MSNLALEGRDCRVAQMVNDAFNRLFVPRADIGISVFPLLFTQCDTCNLRCPDR